jgi:uncharacterized RDD family membrane protein YckC
VVKVVNYRNPFVVAASEWTFILAIKQSTLPDERVYGRLPLRLLAMLYDAVILLGLLMLAAAIALPFGGANKIALHDFWFTLWLLFVCFVYLAVCWRYGGMTIGMRAWRLRLICDNERIISWPLCLLRFIVGLVSLAAFGLGIFWALFDSKNRGWHDLAARTLLIRMPKHL